VTTVAPPKTCKRNHDLSAEGALNAQGKCKECVKITSREIRAEIRAGDFSRMRKPICKHGHDKRVVGISPNGSCRECHRIRRRASTRRNRELGVHRPVEHLRPICPRGHDKRIVGVSDTGSCYRCYLGALAASSLRLRKRRAGFDGDPQPVPQLKAVRHAAGMTGAEMARRIGVNIHHYYQLENGRKTPWRKTLARIVDAVAEIRRDALETRRPVGRYGRLILALNEAERRGTPHPKEVAELAGEDRRAMGTLLRELKARGLAERFEPRPGPKGGSTYQPAVWLLTDEGRKMLRDAACSTPRPARARSAGIRTTPRPGRCCRGRSAVDDQGRRTQ
jgi:transcriptional regulator with XRE-family HTH domain